MKLKTVYICRECQGTAPKWAGRCVQCGGWNTLFEDVVDASQSEKVLARPLTVSKVSLEDAFAKRLPTGMDEFDRVLGGGLVHDSFVLLTGDPGIGKSTLVLQISLALAKDHQVLYVSGEESVSQISLRARRLQSRGNIPDSFRLISGHDVDALVATVEQEKPQILIADSIQTLFSPSLGGIPGSVSQIRTIAQTLMSLAKNRSMTVILIGHVNKDGDLAGPKLLEHLVDTVLYLEGDPYQSLRILRTPKNRFGSTAEIGVFSLEEDGLREMNNPSEIFLKGRKSGATGSALSITLEGSRPFVVEIQALTNQADFSYPKRMSSGVDLNRVQLLTAVLNKHARLKLDQQDVYVNVAGGFRVRDPALDAAIAAAIISSRLERPLPEGFAMLGEIGLSGEIRPASQEKRRLQELEKLGLRVSPLHDVRELVKMIDG